MKVGDVLRVRNWDHHEGETRYNFSVGRQPKNAKTVAVMLYLGTEPFDGTKPQLDLEARMNALGWVKMETAVERLEEANKP